MLFRSVSQSRYLKLKKKVEDSYKSKICLGLLRAYEVLEAYLGEGYLNHDTVEVYLLLNSVIQNHVLFSGIIDDKIDKNFVPPYSLYPVYTNVKVVKEDNKLCFRGDVTVSGFTFTIINISEDDFDLEASKLEDKVITLRNDYETKL